MWRGVSSRVQSESTCFLVTERDDCVVHESVWTSHVHVWRQKLHCSGPVSEAKRRGYMCLLMLSMVWSALLTPFENAIGAWRGGKAERLGLLSCVAKNGKDILTFWRLYLESNVQLVLKEPGVPVSSS